MTASRSCALRKPRGRAYNRSRLYAATPTAIAHAQDEYEVPIQPQNSFQV
ncbi:hypothetical protein PKB_2109 [Pseudomonas knackmussii B13]|uniref:Uncharacterized protein n=1 Tax=Pseudomonas knackmussii (strain DSM 6978 / CCUG 54928 / LMG 23759 / B13) TaxID=1301098 RepID=A0A024HF00_PSEKB|nr:hypothetical protein PKB_2109 [Pseudomonas knackmussii B13]